VRWDERAARPCAYTGVPDNGMWIPERGLGDTDGIPVDTGGISVTGFGNDERLRFTSDDDPAVPTSTTKMQIGLHKILLYF